MIGLIEEQPITRGHKTLGDRRLFKPRYLHQSLLYIDSEVPPKPPTILYRHLLAVIEERTPIL